MTILLLALATFLAQAGFHAWTATLPLALANAGTPEGSIGLIVGTAALVQIPAAILGGRLVDRFGGIRLFLVGAMAYLLAAALLLLPGIEPEGSALPYVIARVLQGAGIALTLPSALSLVPGLVPPERLGSGLAIAGASQNLALMIMPPLSLALLAVGGLDAVALLAIVFVLGAMAVALRLPIARTGLAAATAGAGGLPAAGRRFGITFRRAWAIPLLIVVTYVAHWGTVTVYLPIRADAAGANVGLYFAADGLAIFLMRLPTGWLVDRVPSRLLVVIGAFVTAIAIAMLLLPLTTPLLVASGLLGGAAGALVMTPVLVELSRRSSSADRGSAFALYSGSLASAISLGSIGGAPLVAALGMSTTLVIGIGLIGVALVLALADPLMRDPRREAAASLQNEDEAAEAAVETPSALT